MEGGIERFLLIQNIMTTTLDWENYWINRWNQGAIGWHQAEPEPGMTSFFSGLGKSRVLVPLCGKSKDLLWFLEKGHEVIGIELSPLACESFFKENNIPVKRSKTNHGFLFEGPHITLLNQDIFSTKPEQLGKIDAIYDRAALIALPPEVRAKYASHLVSLLLDTTDKSLQFCQIILERIPGDLEGPPFSISEEELHKLYGKNFSIQVISKEQIESNPKHTLFETVCSLR